MRQTWDGYWSDIARAAASRGTCPRLKVGCVIVKDNRIISTGYNGSLPGDVHCEDVGCLLVDGRCKRTIHAEANAINCASRRDRAGASIYCTHAPCSACAARIIGSGIVEVVFEQEFHAAASLQTYEEAGIVVRHLGR